MKGQFNMKHTKVHSLVSCALIAALYAALTLCLAPLGFGIVQIRFSEALSILAVFTPNAIWGLTVGCMLSNAIGLATGLNPAGFIDIFFGSAATLIAALLAYALRNVKIKGFPVLSTVPPVLVNGIIVGAELTFFESNPFNFSLYGINFLSVSAGQVIPCMGIGLFLYFVLKKFKLDTRLFAARTN